MMNKHWISICIVAGCIGCTQKPIQNTDRTLQISSSNIQLNNAFEWAKEKAHSYVMTGKEGVVNASERDSGNIHQPYIPSYWAGYPFRSAFYSRDYCHQMAGAHLLGLYEENYTMLKAFAASASEEKRWYPLWAINFDGSTYDLDYRNDSVFVREVPAPFELVEKAYDQYLWTGDKRLVEDDVLFNFYTRVVSDFIDFHDARFPNGIAEGDGSGNIFRGVSTYNEGVDEYPCLESGDGIGAQYQAFLAYAGILKARGETVQSEKWIQKAENLKGYFESEWSRQTDNPLYVRGYDIYRQPHWSFSKESCWFMPMKFITDAGERNKMYLDFISESLTDPENIPVNIEAISYLPDTYFPYNRVEEGWKWMQYILDTYQKPHAVLKGGTNGDYPEVSYVVISSIIRNMMGVEADIPAEKFRSVSRLPEEIAFLEIRNIPVGNHLISCRHDGVYKSTLTHEVGEKPLSCDVRFYGNHDYLQVNGKKQKSTIISLNGEVISEVTISLKSGETVSVELL